METAAIFCALVVSQSVETHNDPQSLKQEIFQEAGYTLFAKCNMLGIAALSIVHVRATRLVKLANGLQQVLHK